MTSIELCILALALAGTFALTASAAESGRPGLTLSHQAAVSSAGGAVTVDDARLRAEVAAAAGRAGEGRFVPDLRRRFTIIRTGKPPAINGRLDDPAWRDAVVLRDFTVSQSFNDTRPPSPSADATEAMVLFDDKGLYVGVRAFQDPKTIYTTIKANGWMRPDLDWEAWSEEWANTGCDEIEIVIDPELTMASHYVFHVNPDGVMQKHYMPNVPTGGGSVKRVDA